MENRAIARHRHQFPNHCLSGSTNGILPRGWELHENSSHWRDVRNVDRVQLRKASAIQTRSRDSKSEGHNRCEDVETAICSTKQPERPRRKTSTLSGHVDARGSIVRPVP
jgi:hypothetical protein